MSWRLFVLAGLLAGVVVAAGMSGCDNSEMSRDGALYMLTGKVGPWTDPDSGLTWQNPPAGDSMDWSSAKEYCTNLALDGGGWRLPSIGELRSLVRGCPATESGGSCNVEEGDCLAWSCRDGSCSGCSGDSGPLDGCYWPYSMQGECSWYWSSSPVEDYDDIAWGVDFDDGHVGSYGVDHVEHVRCVR